MQAFMNQGAAKSVRKANSIDSAMDDYIGHAVDDDQQAHCDMQQAPPTTASTPRATTCRSWWIQLHKLIMMMMLMMAMEVATGY